MTRKLMSSGTKRSLILIADFVMPVSRLSLHHNEGVPLDKDFMKSYYFAFESTQIRMIFSKDYIVQARGYYEGEWYPRWTTIDSDYRFDLMLSSFSYCVSKACYCQEVRHGFWSHL